MTRRRATDPAPETTWPTFEYQITVGSYGGLDDRVKLRKKKHPIGFAPPQKVKRAG